MALGKGLPSLGLSFPGQGPDVPLFIHNIVSEHARPWGDPGDQVLVAWPLLPSGLPPDALLFSQAVAMDALSLEQQLPYAFFTQAGSQQPPPPQPQPPPPPPPASQQQPPPPPPQVPVGLPPGGPLMPSASLTRGPQLPPLAVTVPSSLPQSPPENPGQPPMGIDITSVSLGWGRVGPGWGLAGGRGLMDPRGCGRPPLGSQGSKTQVSGKSLLKAPLQGQFGQGSGLKQILPGQALHSMYRWGS